MNAKVQSILSYLGIFWLVAYFGGKDQRNDVSRYHLKQGLGFFIFCVIFQIVLMVLMPVSEIFGLLGFLPLILWIIGTINAVKEVKKPLPIIGKFFENQFSFIDNN